MTRRSVRTDPTESQDAKAVWDWATLLCKQHPELKSLYHIPNEGRSEN